MKSQGWLHEARSLPSVASNTPKARVWTVEQKVQALAGASKLSGEQLTASSSGKASNWPISSAGGSHWRKTARVSRDHQTHPQARARAGPQREGPGRGGGAARAKKNDRLLLQGRGRRHRRAEREVILSAIDEAQASGARLANACQMVGISARTIERWRDQPEGEDARHGPHHRPPNALSPTEEAQVMSVLTSSRYAEVSPKQQFRSWLTRVCISPRNRPFTGCSVAMGCAERGGR
jgi:hypothetical protein